MFDDTRGSIPLNLSTNYIISPVLMAKFPSYPHCAPIISSNISSISSPSYTCHIPSISPWYPHQFWFLRLDVSSQLGDWLPNRSVKLATAISAARLYWTYHGIIGDLSDLPMKNVDLKSTSLFLENLCHRTKNLCLWLPRQMPSHNGRKVAGPGFVRLEFEIIIDHLRSWNIYVATPIVGRQGVAGLYPNSWG